MEFSELLNRIAQGDKSAFAEIYAPIYKQLYYIAYFSLGNADDAKKTLKRAAQTCFQKCADCKSKETFKLAKRLGVILAILMVLDVFIPTADTITKMIVAQNVTYERVETATDVVQTVYEDIMDLFAEGKGEQQAG